jgi:hypothetical protein
VARICTKCSPSFPSTALKLNRWWGHSPGCMSQMLSVQKIQTNLSRTPRNYYKKLPTKLNWEAFLKKWLFLLKQRQRMLVCSQALFPALRGFVNRIKSQRKSNSWFRDPRQSLVQVWFRQLLNKILPCQNKKLTATLFFRQITYV